MKNKILSLLLSLSIIFPQTVNAEDTKEFVDIASVSLVEDLDMEEALAVYDYKDITLEIGSLKIKSVFLFRDEPVPYKGYVIRLKDFLQIESLVEGINKGCDVISDNLLASCKTQLDACQSDCDDRLEDLIKKNDELIVKLDLKSVELEKETSNKYLWTILGTTGGAGLGILVYHLVKQ